MALESFGRVFPGVMRSVAGVDAIGRLPQIAARAPSVLAYGNGRSYGDTCLNAIGVLIDMRSMNRILSFDPQTGLMEAESGVLLSDVIAHAIPHGFFPQVVPGTQYVTLGGAIANDVHGKNHHRRGTFGAHVESLLLLRSDGRIHFCSPTEEPALFAATIGGMGLTGIILSAKIRLLRVPCPDVVEKVQPFTNLAEFFELIGEAEEMHEYAVAWIDQLARKSATGRGLLLTANHCDEGPASADEGRANLSVPFQPPVSLINRPMLKLFNAAYRAWKLWAGTRRSSWRSFFFPLDGVSGWNWLYGPKGLFQHQSVIGEEAAREALPKLLATAKERGQGSFLTVLKRFGPMRSPGLMSFARPGYTLTLDLPNRGRSTLALLRELDAITLDAGGAVNPYKDARMSPEVFEASFPRWEELESMRDPAFMSDFWMRTAMRLSRQMTSSPEAAA